MAKNLKIKVKNTQLAEALKKLKKSEEILPEKQPARLSPTSRTSPVSEKPPEVSIPKASAAPEEAPPPPAAKEIVKQTAPEQQQEAATPTTPSPIPKPIPKPILGPKYPSQTSQQLGPKPPEQRRFTPRPSYQPRSDQRSFGPRQGAPYQPNSHEPRSFGPRPPTDSREFQSPRPAGPGGFGGPRPHTPRYEGSGGPRPYQQRPNQPYQQRPGGGFRGPLRGSQGPYRPPYKPQGPAGAPPRFGVSPIPKDFPSTKAPRGGEETKRKPSFKDKDKISKKPEVYRAFDSRDRQGLRDENDEGWRSRRARSLKSRFTTDEEIVIRPKTLLIRLPITIKDLAAEMKLKASQLLSNLFMKGAILTLNDYLDDETTVQLLGHDFECEITIDTSEEKRLKITDQTIKQEIENTPKDEVILRSPVVAFMGHVDHGKTSLIDAIRKTNTAADEAGAITQHIGAFKSHTAFGDLTILDTPGHEAFSAMRSRGTEVTDIVVLVVAGDEGLRAQTIEAIEQARQGNVPIVVAINKSDKPNFNADNVYRQLAENNLLPEAWGGQTITINCSALTGDGIKTLLEMLALQAEVLELKANPHTRARGAVIESEMHKGMGAVTTVLVQNGTLHLGDAIVFTDHWGRVKTMQDEHGQLVEQASPSTPVKITGLSGLPEAGSDFIVVKDEKEAREVCEERAIQKKHVALQAKRSGLEGLLQQQMQKQEKKVLHLMLRADVQGSLEALKHSLEKIVSSKIETNIVSATVGEISESDIQLAAASKATIIGFHTQIEPRAEPLIKELHVKVRLHDIIYHAVDDVKEIMISLLDRIAQENDVGEVIVKAIFKSSQIGNIAGCQVTEGSIKRSSHVRVIRDKEVIWKGPIASLKKIKEDVREVSKGHECGILLQGFNDFKEGDLLQAYEVTYLTPEL